MKPSVLFLAVLGCAAASPSGYYHQEYNYKTSASSYKNNELQHQTDDQGYYRKDGDLEGKVRPKVDANSEHSEYINPNLRNNQYSTSLTGNPSGDLSSYGHMRANVGSYGSHDLSSEGLARADHLIGTKSGASGYSGSYGSSSYGSHSYGTSSNLRSITSRIQQELENDLQRAIQEQRAYSQSNVGVAELESELRRNLTNRINTELASRYGQQSVRGGLSYTISDGRLHSTANYDNQELQDLRSQLENNLLNQLRTQYHQSSSSYQTHQSSQNNYGYSSTVRPEYYPVHYRPVTTIRPSYPVEYVPSQIRYTPVANPESITTLASRVQNQLDSRLNELLEDVQRRYFSSSSSYSLSNTDVILENLRNDLRNNITYLLNENVKANYGNQIPRDGYMYSIGPSGQSSTQHNYSIRDLENLRTQIERNLIEKLNRDFESQKTRWYQQSSHSQSSQGSSHVRYGGYSTPRYDIYSTPQYNTYDVDTFSTRPASSHIAPLITSGGSSSSNRHYNLLAGSHQSGYEVSGGSGSSSSSISELQSRLQQDLSRQLQAAISRGHYGSYSSSGSYNAPTYQASLQELTNELNRNLTRQLQGYSASGYYSSHGNFDQAQLDNLRSQLQSNLMRQLQQGLQQSFQASSSYSSSSSSSSSNGNYRPVRGFGNYQSGQYLSGSNVLGIDGADCVGDDPNAYNTHRMKRSYPPYRSRPIGLGYSSNRGYTPNYGVSPSYTQQQELGQQVDESDLTQQVEDASFEKLSPLTQQQVDLGQQVDDSELTQQVEDIGKLREDPQSQQQVLGQQVDDSDLTQQVETENFGKLQLDSQNQQQSRYHQQIDDPDLTQQVETENLGKLQLGSQNQQQSYGQQVDDSDLTQQVEVEHFGNLQLGSQNQQRQSGHGQQVDDSDLTQQVEDQNVGRLQLGSQNQQQQSSYGQQVDDTDLTQQVEDQNFGQLQLGSQNQQQTGQQVDDSDLTQQVEDQNFGQLQLGSQNQRQRGYGQQTDNSGLTQQVEDLDSQNQNQVGNSRWHVNLHHRYPHRIHHSHQFEASNFGRPQQVNLDQNQQSELTQVGNVGKLQLGVQGQQQVQLGQQIDDTDSTQQVEDSGFSTPGSYGQQQPNQRGDIAIGNPDLTQQVEVNSAGSLTNPQQVNHYGLTEQVGGSGLGKLQLNSQNQQRVQYGTTQNSNLNLNNLNSSQRQQQTELSQQEDNSDLTQQVEDSVTDDIHPGSVQNPQQREDFGRFTSQSQHQINLGHHQISGDTHYYQLGSNLNQYQRQAALELENELSRQLKDAVRNYYSTSYSRVSNYQTTYEDLVRELQRNLTKQLQDSNPSTGRTRYTYSFVFSGPQIDLLKSQLENELKLQLRHEISTASSNKNIVQEQTNQEISTNGLNQNIDSQSQIQQNIDSDLTQQQQNGFQDVEFGGQAQTEDLTQQINDDQTSQQQGNDYKLGPEEIVQQSINSQNDLTQQVDTNRLENLHLTGQQPLEAESTGQLDNSHLTQTQFGSSGRLQFGRRPGNRKPIDSSNFIDTEINQQQQLYPNQDVVSQQTSNNYKPSNLPTLNQVIQQQPENERFDTESSSPTANLNQQVETDGQQQQIDIDSSFEDNYYKNNHDVDSTDQSISRPGFATNKPLSYSQILRQGNRGYTNSGSVTLQTSQQSNSFNQHQDNFNTYLNNQQVQLAQQLENELSRQLKDAISQNDYAISQSTVRDDIRQQYLQDLQRNITQILEETFSRPTGYSGYSSVRYSTSLTQEQKDKLQRELLEDLSRQLQQNIQVTYGQRDNTQNTFNSRVEHSSTPAETASGSRVYGGYGIHVNNYGRQHTQHQLNYGQQEVVPETEIVSEIHPFQPEQATIVQGGEPQVSNNYNIGVKGSRRSRVQVQNTPVSPVADVEVQQPQSELVPGNVNVGSVPQEVAGLNETPQEDLPWWKRFGNKIKQGATNLKEKIVG